MIEQCWLHIGTEKTGSTSIQTFLAQNRHALCSRGWIYPTSAGAKKHYSLVAFSLDDHRNEGTRHMLGVGDRIGLDDFRRGLLDSLQTEVGSSGAQTVVLSSELLSTRLRRPSEIERLKSLCDSLARQTKVIVYLRNQADFLVSRYTNVIWEGGTGEFAFNARTAIADYALLLDRWSRIFGRENIVVRRFKPADFAGGDLIGDFAGAIGLGIPGLKRPVPSNPSLDAESLEFLRNLNRRLPRALTERFRPFRGMLVRVLQRRRGGTKFLIPRALADRIGEAYGESNERVAAAYFDSRFRPLFSPPLLISDENSVQPTGAGPITTTRIGVFIAFGLLRDGFFWVGKYLVHQFKR